MRILYTTGIYFYRWLICFASMFNKKAKQWCVGRKKWYEKLSEINFSNNQVVWFHCASLGEFEQGRPLIEAIKEKHKDVFVLLTFFSPSGYEIRKDYEHADCVTYLPDDTISNAKRFMKIVKPYVAVFVKYEFWFNYISQIRKNNIRFYSISAMFRENQLFFKPYGRWFLKHLSFFDFIFVQNHSSADLLSKYGLKHCSVSGDTRIDRVYQILKSDIRFPVLEKFVNGSRVVVAGSTWLTDHEFLSPYINQSDAKFIIAPHDISNKNVSAIQEGIKRKYIRYSKIDEDIPDDVQVVLIDSIGMLQQLYRYGDIAYIGGGFGKGIHNTLEPAVFGLPVLFGPKYTKFDEACQMVEEGCAFPIHSFDDLEMKLNRLVTDKSFLVEKSTQTQQFILNRLGATKTILESLDI